MKKIGTAVIAVLCFSALLLGGCAWFLPPQADDVYPFDWAQKEGYIGTEGSWLASLDPPQTLYRRLYEEALADGYDKSYAEFLKEAGLGDSLVQSAVRSAVSIHAYFTSSATGSAGAGAVYSLDETTGDMLVITNYHVVYSGKYSSLASDIELWLYGDESETGKIEAEFLCGAMQYDIAVLKAEGSTSVREEDGGTHTNADVIKASAVCPAVWGDSDGLAVSDRVYAIGNPLGYGISVTSGVLSREAETISIARADDKANIELLELRIDAPVNHGNSGGGLFNDLGELIGIVNARNEEDGADALGYAIPSSLVKPLIENMLQSGGRGARVADPGFTVETAGGRSVYDGDTQRVYIEEKTVVRSIGAGAAFSSGLQIKDTVLAASLMRSGTEVCSAVITRTYMLDNLLLAARSGDELVLTVSRSGETKTVTVRLGGTAFRSYN